MQEMRPVAGGLPEQPGAGPRRNNHNQEAQPQGFELDRWFLLSSFSGFAMGFGTNAAMKSINYGLEHNSPEQVISGGIVMLHALLFGGMAYVMGRQANAIFNEATIGHLSVSLLVSLITYALL